MKDNCRAHRWWRMAASVMIALAFSAAHAGAAPIFFEDWEGEANQLNASLDRWSVSDGTVDVVGVGDVFAPLCVGSPSPGRCLDLDGSTGNAGSIMTLAPIMFTPGNYVLSFFLAGSQRGDTNTARIELDGWVNESITLGSSNPWTQYTYFFTVAAATNASLFFGGSGGDNMGLLLDNISIDSVTATAVPEPTTMFLLGTGLVGLGFQMRRATRQKKE